MLLCIRYIHDFDFPFTLYVQLHDSRRVIDRWPLATHSISQNEVRKSKVKSGTMFWEWKTSCNFEFIISFFCKQMIYVDTFLSSVNCLFYTTDFSQLQFADPE